MRRKRLGNFEDYFIFRLRPLRLRLRLTLYIDFRNLLITVICESLLFYVVSFVLNLVIKFYCKFLRPSLL